MAHQYIYESVYSASLYLVGDTISVNQYLVQAFVKLRKGVDSI